MTKPASFTKTRKVKPLSHSMVHSSVLQTYSQAFWHYNDTVRVNMLRTLRESVVKYFEPSIDLSVFKYFYLTNGITDGLNYYSSQNLNTVIDMKPGEYEYLKFLRKNPSTGDKVFYVTNPSAIDGNYITDETFNKLCNEHDRVILDCAYLGAAKPKKIEMHPNIETVFLGLSKTLGIPDCRIGYLFSKKNIPLLDGIIYDNAYFNMPACLTSIDLLRTYELGYLHTIYKNQQSKVCSDYNLTPSDVYLFGTSTDKQYDYFKRGSINRLCLTEKIDPL